MHKGLREPHILLASSNPQRLIKNLAGVLTRVQLRKIDAAVNSECKLLYALGQSHYNFAVGVAAAEWRQKISRYYYAAYNVKRAVSLRNDGSFSTDSSDHSKIDSLPSAITNHATYSVKLKNLREDRNLADYSHLAVESDLVISVVEAHDLARDFLADARSYLISKGVVL